MIPKNVREGSVAVGLTGEKAMFTIAANGKAFRTLIDGLYSNKVRAVIRELCSNAADSHVAARNEDPFLVQVPTSLDPVFRVRDYGVGLSHEDVMHLYTTIFQSTKEETNEQTGQLGLGSKSPFAYTDSFQVTVWQDGERRQYLAYLETDGVPSITHVSTVASDEPRGLEVSFPVERHDVSQFSREMQFVAIGYKNPPIVEGMELSVPEPRISGTNWEIYPNGSFAAAGLNNESLIRMGSAVYPSGSVRFPHLGYGWISVVEIPIGTADVTASRESLSFDPETRAAVEKAVREAYESLKIELEDRIKNAGTRVQQAKVYAEYNGILDNIRGSVSVSLLHKNLKLGEYQPEGTTLEKASHFGRGRGGRRTYNRYVSSMEVQNLPKVRILVNDPEVTTVRRYLRSQAWGADHHFGYVLDVTDPADRQKAIDWIKKCWELDDSAFVKVSDLPDVPVTRRSSTSQRAVKKAFDQKVPWLPRNNGVITSIYGPSRRGQGEWPTPLVNAARLAGYHLDWEKTVFLTQGEIDKLSAKGALNEDLRLDKMIQKKLQAKVNNGDHYDEIVSSALYNTMGNYHAALDVVIAEFFPKAKRASHQQIGDLRNMCKLAEIDLTTLPIYANIEAEITALGKKFPLLFGNSNHKAYEHYIKAVKTARV